MRGWLYRDIIFSLLTIFSEGLIISGHYIFTPGNIWWGDDYIVTLYIFSLLAIFGQGVIILWHNILTPCNIWSGGDIIFSLLTIFREGVIISWHNILTPDNIWSVGDYIVTLYFHSWQYLVRGDYILAYLHSWQYLVRGWIYRDIIFSPPIIFGEGLIISWHYIFTPGNISWGGDYIVTYFHCWRYLVRGWLYRDITISFLTLP